MPTQGYVAENPMPSCYIQHKLFQFTKCLTKYEALSGETYFWD